MLVAGALAPAGLRALARAGWVRANWRGTLLPAPAGVLAVAASVLALGPLADLDALAGGGLLPREPVAQALVLGLGVAFLGLLDDLLDLPERGWRGHGAALRATGFTTGALKAAGTLALALFALPAGNGPAREHLLAAGVVVAATHAVNLLDTRPGRAVKAWVLLAAGLLAATRELEPLRAIGLLAGPLLVLGSHDLRERAMLGDTGANLLGALAGLWLVTVLTPAGELVALVALGLLGVYGELRSLSDLVARVPPLRALDSFGRRSHG